MTSAQVSPRSWTWKCSASMEGHSSTRVGLKLVSTPITSDGLIEEFT
ncbi:hypothetical protein WKI71_27300 [Streptomyces sp. MS1.AVA.1]|uniref:Uncharacterized protein n=1 Tax=Streptomyces machairae TaxID=3134109 RepID=A0ABU8UPE3_9ACTN